MERTTTARRAGAVVCLGLWTSVLAGMAPSQAAGSTDTLDYDCTVSAPGTSADGMTFTMPTTISSDAPEEAYYGWEDPSGGFSTSVTVDGTLPGDAARQLHGHGWRSVAGTVSDFFTVADGQDPRGVTAPVSGILPDTGLGEQTSATPVDLHAVTWSFGEVRDEPGYLAFKAAESLRMVLQVSVAGDSDAQDAEVACTRVTDAGSWPEIARVAWISRTTTEIAVPDEIEYGELLKVDPTVVAAAGTARGSVTVSSDGERLGTASTTGNAWLRGLSVGRHRVLATFTPDDTVFYRGSTTVDKVTVVKAPSKVKAKLRSATPGRRGRIVVKVAGLHDTKAHGRVRLLLQKLHRPTSGKRTRVARLDRRGRALVGAGRLGAGEYRLRVVYKGDAEHRAARRVRTIRVHR